jgi:hypothetical protein
MFGKFLCGWATGGFLRRAQVHGVSYLPKELNIIFEVLTAVVKKSTVFSDIEPCSLLKINRRFGGTYSLHFHCRISRERYQRESRWSLKVVLFVLILIIGTQSSMKKEMRFKYKLIWSAIFTRWRFSMALLCLGANGEMVPTSRFTAGFNATPSLQMLPRAEFKGWTTESIGPWSSQTKV